MDIHDYFGLTYSQYLSIPRTALQSMPVKWQEKFVILLNELDDKIDWRPEYGNCYQVLLRKVVEKYDDSEECFVTEWGDIIDDPLSNYERGRRKLKINGE